MVSIRNRPPGKNPDIGAQRTGTANIPTRHGAFTAHAYLDSDGLEQMAYVAGDLTANTVPIVRVHSECLTGDVLGSLRCDCGSQLESALGIIANSDAGIVIYLRGHEGRGIGLGPKLQAYDLQDQGHDTVEANELLGLPVDSRDYGVAAAILADLGIERVRLLTNNPAKLTGLTEHGIEVTEQIQLPGATTPDNQRYLETKRDRLNHQL